MILLVDKSEESSAPDVVARLKDRFANVHVVNLPHRDFGNTSVTAGDINIPLDDGSILAIERKTPDDFLQSIPTRHIFNQVEIMHSVAKFVAVVITGKLSFSPDSDKVVSETETNRVERYVNKSGTKEKNGEPVRFGHCSGLSQ